MRIVDVIEKKRNKEELDAKEIEAIVGGFAAGVIPDYQMAAWLMAIYFQGMTKVETSALTMAMANSGKIMDLSSIPGIKVDKHSTGGVGDTTTLVVAPLVAAAGVPVAKMSGRGLGFTGGTVDKLEAIPGFRTQLSIQEFLIILREHFIAVTGQTPDIAPADGKIYALRDVTGTVPSIPLIASSIMSKKIAAGADKIILDVKVGSGAFMKTVEQALELAETMVAIGSMIGLETRAILTNMDEPLGQAVGNSMEIAEALDILSGKGRGSPLEIVCLTLGAHMLEVAGTAASFQQGYALLEEQLATGHGLAKFREMVVAQGGDPAVITRRELLPQAKYHEVVVSQAGGYIQHIDAALVGRCAMLLGAGREVKGQAIDLGAGIMLDVRVGDRVDDGQGLACLHANQEGKVAATANLLRQAISLGPDLVEKPPLIIGLVDVNGVQMIGNSKKY